MRGISLLGVLMFAGAASVVTAHMAINAQSVPRKLLDVAPQKLRSAAVLFKPILKAPKAAPNITRKITRMKTLKAAPKSVKASAKAASNAAPKAAPRKPPPPSRHPPPGLPSAGQKTLWGGSQPKFPNQVPCGPDDAGVRCKRDPCAGATCVGSLNAHCIPNFCQTPHVFLGIMTEPPCSYIFADVVTGQGIQCPST